MSGNLKSRLVLAYLEAMKFCQNEDHTYLEAHGWIPLSERASDGRFDWTTLKRGLAGAVSTEEALRIEREKGTK